MRSDSGINFTANSLGHIYQSLEVQNASPTPSPQKRDQISNSTHDFGLSQRFPNFAAHEDHLGRF